MALAPPPNRDPIGSSPGRVMPSLVDTFVPVFRCRMVPLGSMDHVMQTEFSVSTSSTSSLETSQKKKRTSWIFRISIWISLMQNVYRMIYWFLIFVALKTISWIYREYFITIIYLHSLDGGFCSDPQFRNWVLAQLPVEIFKHWK